MSAGSAPCDSWPRSSFRSPTKSTPDPTTPQALAPRVDFQVGDAAELVSPDGDFDLVVLSNMIPFFDELARIVEAGGRLVLSFSRGAETPIYVPPERLREELGPRGFAEFAEFSAPPATAFRAKRS